VSDWSRREFIRTVGAAGTAAALLGPRAVAQAAPAKRSPPLRFGVQTPPQNTTFQDLVSIWKEADDLCFDSAFAFDHFMPIMGLQEGLSFAMIRSPNSCSPARRPSWSKAGGGIVRRATPRSW